MVLVHYCQRTAVINSQFSLDSMSGFVCLGEEIHFLVTNRQHMHFNGGASVLILG